MEREKKAFFASMPARMLSTSRTLLSKSKRAPRKFKVRQNTASLILSLHMIIRLRACSFSLFLSECR